MNENFLDLMKKSIASQIDILMLLDKHINYLDNRISILENDNEELKREIKRIKLDLTPESTDIIIS